MGQLNKKHLNKIEKYLDRQGLSFQPLRDEMMDHLIEDLENHMQQGNSFDEAWQLIMSHIPDNHFKTLQNEIMEIINKRFSLSEGFTYLSLLLLFTMAVFKLLHFPLSGILLLASFGAIAASLLTGVLSGLYLYKDKKGSLMALGVVLAVILFLVSFAFQVLKLPGLMELRTISVAGLILFFPGLTIYFSTQKNNEENILTYLHKKHSPGIQRYLIFLLVLAVALRIALIVFGYHPDVATVLLVLVIGGAGLQYFALNWHDPKTQNWGLAAGLVVGFICFMLPVLLNLQLSNEVRVGLTLVFYTVTGLIVLKKSKEVPNKKVLIALLFVAFLFFVLNAFIKLNIVDASFNAVIFNLPVLIILSSGLFLYRRQPLIKVYLIMVIAYYMFEFPNQLGL